MNQGTEGSGYADHAYLEAIAKAVPGLDVKKAFALVSSGKVTARIDQAKAFSQQYGINQTPSFLIGQTGDEQNMTVVANRSGQGLYSTIDDALAGNPVPAKSKSFPAWAVVLIAMAGAAALAGAVVFAVRLRKRPSAPPPAA
jgi:predicted DsbA family dithiol-disulfide isomerase